MKKALYAVIVNILLYRASEPPQALTASMFNLNVISYPYNMWVHRITSSKQMSTRDGGKSIQSSLA
jgi:hypothetical protein